jgi:hypothetical protein
MAYPPAEHVPTRLLTLARLRADLAPALKAEDDELVSLRARFLSESAFLDTPIVQFHSGQREALAFVLGLIDEMSSEAMEQ